MGGKVRVHIFPRPVPVLRLLLSSSIHFLAAAMPAPAVYIAFAVVGVVAVGVAFHEVSVSPGTDVHVLR